MVRHTSGKKDQLFFPPEVRKHIKGNVFTHNHPDTNIAALSDGDIYMAMGNQVKEVRAVSVAGQVSRMYPKPGKKWPKNSIKLSINMETSIDQANKRIDKMIKEKKLIIRTQRDEDEANQEWYNIAMGLFAKKSGLIYERYR